MKERNEEERECDVDAVYILHPDPYMALDFEKLYQKLALTKTCEKLRSDVLRERERERGGRRILC